jgi:hypothetical protein
MVTEPCSTGQGPALFPVHSCVAEARVIMSQAGAGTLSGATPLSITHPYPHECKPPSVPIFHS